MIVCPYCVQWRCTHCKDPQCYGECETGQDFEPYWPDGSVAVLTQQDTCDRCVIIIDEYNANRDTF